MKYSAGQLVEKAGLFFWFLMIVSLPITSMPIVAKILGSDSVASPSILFLIPVSLLSIIPHVWQGKKFPSQIVPLICFFCVAGIASVLSFFYVIPPFKSIQQLPTVANAFITLVIGILFFIAFSSLPKKLEVRQNSMRILNWSGALILLWCFVQAAYWYLYNHYPTWMFELQGLISDRVLYRQRVTGFALEPSWLAHQLNLLYLPIWLTYSIINKTNHRFRLLVFTFENILLFGGIITLFLTFSRVGLLSFITMAVVLVLFLHGRILNQIESYTLSTNSGNRKFSINRKLLSFLLFFAYSIFLLIIAFVLSRTDPRMANLFKFTFKQDNSLLRFFDDLKFGDRVVYWLTGWSIFNKYPLFGVGLGNSGYFFNDHIPSFGWTLVEVKKLMYHTDLLLNTKSLWVRLLAETGLIGFAFFAGWLYSTFRNCLSRIKSNNSEIRILGGIGIFALAAMIAEGFSVDSFAMPYWWICIGFSVSDYCENL